MQQPWKEDFRNFLYIIFKHLNIQPTKRQYEVAHYLGTTTHDRVVFEGFRGIGKSWIVATLVLWHLLRDPQLNILVVSASKDRADNFTSFCLRLINEVPILAQLKPGKDDRSSLAKFDVGPARSSQSASVTSKGITSQMTGARADIIIADDVEVLHNSDTEEKRLEILKACMDFESIIKPLSTSKILFLGTPQTESTIYKRLEEKGYTVVKVPAKIDASYISHPETLLPAIQQDLLNGTLTEGMAVDGERFDESILAVKEGRYGRSGFQLQFQLDTTLSDQNRYPLKLKDLVVLDLPPSGLLPEHVIPHGPRIKELKNLGMDLDYFRAPMALQGNGLDNSALWIAPRTTVMALDPGGSGADETGGSIISELNGQLFLRKIIGLSGGFTEENLTTIAQLVKTFNVHHIIIEENFGLGMFAKLLEPYVIKARPGTQIESVRHSTQKEKRIIGTLEPLMNQGRLIVSRAVVDEAVIQEDILKNLFYQLTRVSSTRGCLKHDDRLDALAMACAHFVERMNVDIERLKSVARQDALDRELREFTRFGKNSWSASDNHRKQQHGIFSSPYHSSRRTVGRR